MEARQALLAGGKMEMLQMEWDAWKAVETGLALRDRLWSVLVRPDPAPLGFVVNGASGAEPHWGHGHEEQQGGERDQGGPSASLYRGGKGRKDIFGLQKVHLAQPLAPDSDSGAERGTHVCKDRAGPCCWELQP